MLKWYSLPITLEQQAGSFANEITRMASSYCSGRDIYFEIGFSDVSTKKSFTYIVTNSESAIRFFINNGFNFKETKKPSETVYWGHSHDPRNINKTKFDQGLGAMLKKPK